MKIIATATAFAAILTTAASASGSITPIDDLQRGTMVTVQGTVERITDEDEFRLADATGSVRIYVGPNWVPADVGEAVTVKGFVDDDLGPLEIYARNLTRADGSVITFDRRYE
ncbi:NirD/YgiW/YdeI family stress tolerance protein [Denitrobaculum tricleocarpae]|uniref:NirD/YgiW/YdeI family stress tolerance protein n=1 Tax=Denitrobaculum tricleocarpae TaxID=2591009 RepID=A0A545U0V4_9PROT|nr:NirD/YgiW/YdeI family stress tolerance protein [Denitrobaculum tricleocarpae]TQV83110.1 NirD/YgiW/YdeI family stress tolerance protein [Denitrobaculum tricleocarpae]